MEDWPIIARYDAAHLREIAMPIGGIGTGFFALGGNGRLTDWQLMSRPNRGWRPKYSHLIVRTKQTTGRNANAKLRVLETDLNDDLAADFGAPGTLAGLPRFPKATFESSYPFGRVLFTDRQLPITVSLEAFNPLIPRDTDASSLPFALLSVTLTNTTAAPVETSLTLLLSNFLGTDGLARDLKDNVTEPARVGEWQGMRFDKTRPTRTAQSGTLAVLCDAPDVRIARRWTFQDRAWGGEALGLMDALLAEGFVPDADPNAPCPPSPNDTWHSALSALVTLPPKAARTIRLLLTWHFPYRDLKEEGWPVVAVPPGDDNKETEDNLHGNYYATQFADALDVAAKVLPRLDDLRARTVAFVRSVADNPAPQPLKEAALFNLTALRTHTSFRLADGVFAGWEGCGGTTGCCHGSCTHVWNYAAVSSLFPDLSRSMLESHLKHGVTATGAQRFRLTLPIVGQPSWNAAAADGQMGLIVRCYEQYLLDKDAGGLDWLRREYPTIKRMLEFAWQSGGWDGDKDGVMEGAQHNTYDVEFFGPNPLGTVWYLAALAAMERMAILTEDTAFAGECKDLRLRGSAWVDRNLFNGQFYIQRVQMPPAHPAAMTTLGMAGEKYDEAPRFQMGEGCLIDQLCGQYKANRVGLGDLLDGLHIKTTLAAIFKNNYRAGFRDHYNNMRTFATADESGTLICSYPNGGRPAQPFPYWSECMTGFEYQFAVLLLDYGFTAEAVKVAKAVRDRHNGANRNPFNEPECGSYYARAMASWALLDAWKA